MENLKCNCCGKQIRTEQGIRKEDVLEIVKSWGYFSGKDGEQHRVAICEACYDIWISGFAIPPERVECTELL